jgi:predicted HNH restriction endonuclease
MPYRDPEVKRRHQKEYFKRYRAKPNVKRKLREKARRRYWSDAEYRERVRARALRSYRERGSKLYGQDLEFREKKKEKSRQYQRELRQRARINTRDPRMKHYLNYRRTKQLGYLTEARRKVLELFGTNCYLCGFDTRVRHMRIEFHEIHGRRHNSNNNVNILKNPKDYVPLCSHCHRMVTWLMKLFHVEWSDILELKKSKPKRLKPFGYV